jgi:hypothetical protein
LAEEIVWRLNVPISLQFRVVLRVYSASFRGKTRKVTQNNAEKEIISNGIYGENKVKKRWSGFGNYWKRER